MSYIASGGSQMPSFSPVFLNPPKHGFAARVRAIGPQTALADIGRHWQIFSKLICQLADFLLFLNATLLIQFMIIRVASFSGMCCYLHFLADDAF